MHSSIAAATFFLWLVEKSKLARQCGSVSHMRRRQIEDKLNAALGWKLV
ncbi:hypothetical protein [Prosthecobacter sp.]